ncbi:hypothetical protein CO661_02850 [Sinorhizobium fredii]|uniref:Propionyl-coenzyme A carboxylase alpha polypeptide n=1 Tax=Rhizobium fredii TaxID=380 RepID=A0A2A6M545_RHIFR|nr:hypothetical protein CO661_02850 [Sinorhizobium fredii]
MRAEIAAWRSIPPSALPSISPTRGEIEEEPFCSTRNSGGATDIQMKWGARFLPLSPLVGEMPGRAEGGAFDEYALGWSGAND